MRLLSSEEHPTHPGARSLERKDLTTSLLVVVRAAGSITSSASVKPTEKCVYVRVGSW
jgi:hypothetical protein